MVSKTPAAAAAASPPSVAVAASATPPLAAALILPLIVPPVVTAAPRDYGASSQIAYDSTSNVRATRAMDDFPFITGGGTYTNVIADATRGFVVPVRPPYAPNDDVKIARVVASCSKACVRIRDGSNEWTIGDSASRAAVRTRRRVTSRLASAWRARSTS